MSSFCWLTLRYAAERHISDLGLRHTALAPQTHSVLLHIAVIVKAAVASQEGPFDTIQCTVIIPAVCLSVSPSVLHLLKRERRGNRRTEKRAAALHCESNFASLVRNFYRGSLSLSPSEPESRTVLRAASRRRRGRGGGQGCMINECTNNTVNTSEWEEGREG